MVVEAVVIEGADADNGACANIFCMIWESHSDNSSRKACHKLFGCANMVTSNDTMCICFLGGTISCILGRAHQSHQDVKTA